MSVGVISVDPSSPFTQGALLGDRIRLAEHFLDREVFIRSMGTRGHLGGVAEATLQASLVLDAAGKQVIFVETVGVGQSEIEIASITDTVVLALMPGSGDSVQALKAGIMEIPDVIVVNKKDHPESEKMVDEVRMILHLTMTRRDWEPPVIATSATTGEGVRELWDQIRAHRSLSALDGGAGRASCAADGEGGLHAGGSPDAGAASAQGTIGPLPGCHHGPSQLERDGSSFRRPGRAT